MSFTDSQGIEFIFWGFFGLTYFFGSESSPGVMTQCICPLSQRIEAVLLLQWSSKVDQKNTTFSI